jgi:hypothetical protein
MRADPTTFMPRSLPACIRGIRLQGSSAQIVAQERQSFLIHLEQLGLRQCVEVSGVAPDDGPGFEASFLPRADLARVWAPGLDTTSLHRHVTLDTGTPDDELEREIVLAMLLSPLAFDYPSYAELAAAVRIRRNIVIAARKTALAFCTAEAERPDDCWRYEDGKGFVVRPGCALIPALIKATQPDVSGKLYSFSCYRATEYVILLGIAQELEQTHPALLARLQRQWEQRPIMSGQFHDVFLHEYGSMDWPLPTKYYVPGDRLWFRNPDAHSSDASGYEGSWVFYLGGGLFTNFWKRGQAFTLTDKCVEIFHWRHAIFTDSEGELRIDEAIVEQRVRQTLASTTATAEVMETMLRLRDAKGIYSAGGCIDTSREVPRRVCPGTADLRLPER